jgi:hypothetical protein
METEKGFCLGSVHDSLLHTASDCFGLFRLHV